MNSLEQYLEAAAIDPVAAMNFLQGDCNCISDLAVTPADVAEIDCPAAIAALAAAVLQGAAATP